MRAKVDEITKEFPDIKFDSATFQFYSEAEFLQKYKKDKEKKQESNIVPGAEDEVIEEKAVRKRPREVENKKEANKTCEDCCCIF